MLNIKIDYGQVIYASTKLSNISNLCSQASTDLKNATSFLDADWQGAAKNSFSYACEKVVGQMKELSQLLNNVSHELRNIANTYKEIDEQQKRMMLEGM